MKRGWCCVLIAFTFPARLVGQADDKLPLPARDTVASLSGVTITAYTGRQYLLRTPASVSVISKTDIDRQPGNSMVPVFNMVPGVRMEERSPSSYRLSIRGSLLRSPFGVRNVKMYMNGYPLTDAGGNTYLNALGITEAERIDILKGPDGSLFGANSGGVVLLRSVEEDTLLRWQGALAGGAFGLFRQQAALSGKAGRHTLGIKQSWQQADGYRQQSRNKRFYAQLSDAWQYNDRNRLSFFSFYSNMMYQTPGGLTLAQFNANPRSARPAAGQLPGAIEQKAGIYNKMILAGLAHEAALSARLQHTVAVFGVSADISNPFITNYETRQERTKGLRSFLTWSDAPGSLLQKEISAGLEWQQTGSLIRNFDNNAGEKGELQAENNILSDQHFFFTRARMTIHRKWVAEAALSLNYYSYRFRDALQLKKRFTPQWMPRWAMSYELLTSLVIRATVSKGYSPPTIAEVRPSDNQVYAQLEPEQGWNREIGLRFAFPKSKGWVDVSVFDYRLRNAIVRQLNVSGAEYFVNAGSTKQRGLESQVAYRLGFRHHNRLIHSLFFSNSSTWNAFRFNDYQVAGMDYSGNRLTGVPRLVVVSGLQAELAGGYYFFIQHNYTGRLPLNDANTIYADKYHLMQLKLGRKMLLYGSVSLETYAGIDNLLNQRYSLGNDINAAGSRFYNAAPSRHFFGGLLLRRG